jgi:hypothetical protein
VSTHNRKAIFNVDICGGLPALVLTMLVRSAYGRIDLLPALPGAWPRGWLAGAAARDEIVVEHLAWSTERLEAVLRSARDQQFVLGLPPDARLVGLTGADDRRRTADGAIAVAVKAGVPLRVRADREPATRGSMSARPGNGKPSPRGNGRAATR